jgi:hypothetical protein
MNNAGKKINNEKKYYLTIGSKNRRNVIFKSNIS